jgi:hypothetical protein
MTLALTTTDRALTTTDVMTAFGAFLRLYVADGDASSETIRSYYGIAARFVARCGEHGTNPATVTENDIATYCRELLAQYEVGTVAVKLLDTSRLQSDTSKLTSGVLCDIIIFAKDIVGCLPICGPRKGLRWCFIRTRAVPQRA